MPTAALDDLDSFVKDYRAKAAPAADDDLDSFVQKYSSSQLKTPIPFAPPAPRQSPTEAAAKVGQPLTTLTPPPADTSTTPVNVFSGQAQAPGMRTEEETKQLGTIGPASGHTVEETARRVVPRAFRDQPVTAADNNAINLEGFMTPVEQEKHPYVTGAAQAVSGLTSPENVGLLAATGGIGAVPGAIGKLAKVGISTLFGSQMLKGAYDSIPGIKAARDRGDWNEVKRLATLAGINTAMGAAALGHAGLETFTDKVPGRPGAPAEGAAAPEGEPPTGAPPVPGKWEPLVPDVNALLSAARPEQPKTPPNAVRTPSEPTSKGPVSTSSFPEGHIGPKQEPLAPEKPETLKAQVDALAAGSNKVVYIPKGTETIPAPPENAKVTVVPGDKPGAGTYYHTADVKPSMIEGAVNEGTFGKLLGNTQGKSEAVAGGKPAAVIARDESGNEVKSALADSTNPQAVAEQAAVLARQFPNAKIGIEPPEKVVNDRLGLPTKPPGVPQTEQLATKISPARQEQIFTTIKKKFVDDRDVVDSYYDAKLLRSALDDPRKADVVAGDPAVHDAVRGAISALKGVPPDQAKALVDRLVDYAGQQKDRALGKNVIGPSKFPSLPSGPERHTDTNQQDAGGRNVPLKQNTLQGADRRTNTEQRVALAGSPIESRIKQLRAQLRDPSLTGRDREIMQSQLDTAIAHPEDFSEADVSRRVQDMKVEQKLTREEALANQEKRKAGIPQAKRATRQAAQPLAEKYSPETLADARDEMRRAAELATTFERPGRYVVEHAHQGDHYTDTRPNDVYGIPSSRNSVAEQYPWYRDIKAGPQKLADLVAKGKGAEHDRILDDVAKGIEQRKADAKAAVAGRETELRETARQVRSIDPDLADELEGLAEGRYYDVSHIKNFVDRKLHDSKAAAEFNKIFEDYASETTAEAEAASDSADLREPGSDEEFSAEGEPLQESDGEVHGRTAGSREKESSTGHEVGIFPEMGEAVAAQKSGAAKVQAEKLTDEINSPKNIDKAAGEMESKSPLFRGKGPQKEIFGGDEFDKFVREREAEASQLKVGDRISAKTGPLKGAALEVTKATDTGAYVREGEGPVKFLKADNVDRLLDVEGKPITTGPGTPLKDHFDNTGTRMEQLAEVIHGNAAGSKPVTTRIDFATKLAEKQAAGKDATASTLSAIKGAGAAMIDAFRHPPKWTEFYDALGKYQGAIQKSSFGLRQFAKALRAAVPDKTRREGITNFIEAAGDTSKLKDWADNSSGKAKRGYEAALKLNDAERTIARNLISAQEERFELDKAAGLIEHEVENYVMHAWKKENPYTKKLVSTVRAEMLKPNPSFTKQRVFGTYFDGEKLGYAPVDKDAGFLFATREHAANEALAARTWIRNMLDGEASDGRPLVAASGAGKTIGEEGKPPEAYMVDAKIKPEDAVDYRTIDHPALRKWTWAATDENGKPIFVKGDLMVHPEIYKKLKNVLGKSALRTLTIPGTDIQPFAMAQRLSAEFKGTMLSLSGFHQTQESLHAIFHGVNPLTTEPIDFTDPVQMKLVEHGLQVSSFHAQQEFGEGVTSGLTNRLPLVGKYFQKYNEYLFSGIIPRLKMTMAQDALARNMKRYSGKLGKDEIYALTANQANAAFGELNYTMMARNKTMQDVLRMALLAPDFLEARGRFVGQALKPYGREQAFALIKGAVGMYVVARVVNQLIDKDPHWDAQDAFNIVYKGKTYTLRSVPADIAHLFEDPRGFVYNRLNPVYGKGLVEGLTGRDKYGRKQSVTQQVKDVVGGGLPIPFQGFKKNPDAGGALDTVLGSTGVSTFPYKTPAERLAMKITMDNMPLGEGSEERKDANRLARQYEDQLRKKEIKPADLAKARQDGKITVQDQHKILARAARTPLQNSFRYLAPDQALQVWDKASPVERQQIRPMLASKLSGLDKVDPSKRADVRKKIMSALHPPQNQTAGIPRTAPFAR